MIAMDVDASVLADEVIVDIWLNCDASSISTYPLWNKLAAVADGQMEIDFS